MILEEGQFKSFDGTLLNYQAWKNPGAKANIVLCHGLSEHSGTYKILAEGLTGSPFDIIALDLRGHGRSEGNRGVGTIDQYVLDFKVFVHDIIDKKYSENPKFFLGHSMGGLVVTKFLIRNGSMGAKGVVLSSPLFGVAVEVPFLKKKSAKLLSLLAPNFTLGNEINHSQLTHDIDIIREHDRDQLRHNRISSGLFLSMEESMDYCFKNEDKITGPLFLQQAGDDKIISRKRSEEFFANLKCSDKEIKIYPNMYHEIYNEKDRKVPHEDLKNWLTQKLSGVKRG